MKQSMKLRKAMALLCCMTLMGSLVGCGSTPGEQGSVSTEGEQSSVSAEPSAETVKSYGKEKYPEEITIDVYDTQANYMGEQSGWFAKVVEDRFNMKLNIISANVGGSSLFETRSANGNLGDLILTGVSGGTLDDLVEAGLVMDMTDYIGDCENLQKYMNMIESTSSLASEKGIWAVPCEVSTLSPTEPSETTEPTGACSVRFDLYEEIGMPEIETLEDLLPVMKQMQEAAGTSESGKKVYAFSCFGDWDGGIMQNATVFPGLFGWDFQGTAMYNIADLDSPIISVIDNDSFYVRSLRFLYQANQMGLVDPESTTQTYDTLYNKIKDGAVLYGWWPWLGTGAYNSSEHTSEGKGFASIVLNDMKIGCFGNYAYGNNNNAIMVGSKAQDPQRMVDFIDWLYSPEGICMSCSDVGGNCGPEGLTWEKDADGKAVLTDFGIRAFVDREENLEMPEEYGGGTWKDGISQLNYQAVGVSDINEETGMSYAYAKWPDYIELTKTKLSEDWNEWTGYTTSLEYFKANDWLAVRPGINYSAPAYTTEISAINEQVGQIIRNYSWQMVFAENDDQFESLLKEMQDTCKGLGIDSVYEVDEQNLKDKIAAYKEAMQ